MRRSYYAAGIAAIILSAGCAHYGALEGDFGKSHRMARDGQILNPAASRNREPVAGMSGKAAAAAEKKYIDSFSKGSCEQPAQQGFTITPVGATGTDIYGK